ncbi:MAG: hypothetical protein EVB00_00430 [SAR86 cluster bacterium]|uniref:Cell division protein FtsB n=1 Tax=SAR86 cluster bacterium TaxID=2030880 RepID=A0A520MC94_9GAMM|nr:MAG: hypothetical protein EVB00_00430 [SAR86 cluster bacterium]|tara:strand:- start:1720 stop:2025 length:306 start_codon:yes stop_codon:yes gene_type:complete
MNRVSIYIFVFLLTIILVLSYNLFISSNGYKERDSLINQNNNLQQRNKAIRDSNEELKFEIINAQDSDEHIENYARENLNLSMPDEEFIKFNKKDVKEEDE